MGIADNLRSIPKLFFVPFAFLCGGALFLLIALATPHWYVGVVRHLPVNAGLWKSCYMSICFPLPAIGKFVTLRALSVLAFLGSGGSGLAAVAFIFLEQRRKLLGFLIAAGCSFSFLFNTITVILYAVWISDSPSFPVAGTFGLGWSFIISCLGSVFLLIASVLGFFVAFSMQSRFG